MINKFHPYHIVEVRPWPIKGAVATFLILSSIVAWFQFNSIFYFFSSLIILLLIAFEWWKDLIRESKNQGFHNIKVINGLKIGIILFITSEVIFFFSFFWAYFHRSTRPNIEIGQTWPPFYINSFNPINVPLLNTIILLSSGVSVTWSHHSIISNLKLQSFTRLLITILLGIYFSSLQAIEYIQSEFSIADSIYGASFFIATGFHGIHVLIGTSFLIFILIRLNRIDYSITHITGFEIAAWYWHFVDVVWLFLYLSIYWWSK